jgi:hypothetical protein
VEDPGHSLGQVVGAFLREHALAAEGKSLIAGGARSQQGEVCRSVVERRKSVISFITGTGIIGTKLR